MNKSCETVEVSIDNRTITAPRGATILEASQLCDIYIPTLCAHKDLTPFGGCRMCIVEVEKMRGFPTACTTPIEEGMVIRTHTAQIQSIREEILQLILSEHPSSCLICDESADCKEFSGTIRKTGVTTGCRWCANDGQCELQKVVEWVGISEIKYPIYYRHLPIEKMDPFYDRDYNLCILCGRCIRVCQEVRAANTLTFRQRGCFTTVGPAYERTHLEAGCEFCGACVEVCPTGALSEKTRKWSGPAEKSIASTCALCGIGCQIELQVKNNEVIGVLPADDPLINNGQLCVKGRFCVPELVSNHRRLKQACRTGGNTRVQLSMPDAIALAAGKLASCSQGKAGMIVSPNLSNEDLYVAQKFMRQVLSSHNIDCSARGFYGPAFKAYLELLKMASPMECLRKAEVILCIGIDTRYGRSVAGVELRRAIKGGAKIITINSRHHNLTAIADIWLRPMPGAEFSWLEALLNLIEGKSVEEHIAKADLTKAAHLLRNAPSSAILIGAEFMHYGSGVQILNIIAGLARTLSAAVMPMPSQNNLMGTILMGVYPELLPGGKSSHNSSLKISDLCQQLSAPLPKSDLDPSEAGGVDNLELLYLIGEVPPSGRLSCDYLINQNIYPPDPFYNANLILPAAAFTEIDGSFINGEGRLQRVRKAVCAPGEALPDWEILCHLACEMGAKGFDYSSVFEIDEEISGLIPDFCELENPKRIPHRLDFEGELEIFTPGPKECNAKTAMFPLCLTSSIAENIYRGFPISNWVPGMKDIAPEGTVDMNPADAQKIGVAQNDRIVVVSDHFEKIWPVRIHTRQREGTLHVTLFPGEFLGLNPHPVNIRRADV